MNSTHLSYLIIGLILINIGLNDLVCSDKIFFDDFSYTGINIATKLDSAYGSIFGYNDWIYPDGIKKAKAWYRWNIGEPQYESLCGIEMNKAGFDLYVKKGIKQKSFQPVIHSTFRFRHGTYASRVRFPSHYKNDLTDIAYWLFSPYAFGFNERGQKIQYASEMDFEWNNWFLKKNKDNMTIGTNNHDYRYPFQLSLGLSAFKNGIKISDVSFSSKIDNKDIFYNQFYICVFVVDTINRVTKIYMKSDFDSLPGITVFGGHAINSQNEINPFVINNYSPDYDMIIYYTFMLNSPEASNDNSFGTDWTFYSSDANLSFDDIKTEVSEMKQKGITRINTADAPAYIHNEQNKTFDCFFSGPDSVMHGIDADWKIDVSYKRWTAYIVDFKFRTYEGYKDWSDWQSHYSNHFRFNSGCKFDSLELSATFKDVWRDITGLVEKKIHFTKNPDCRESDDNNEIAIKVYPIPASFFLYITQTGNLYHKISALKIYSSMGTLIYESDFSSVLDIGWLSPGVYILAADKHFVKFIKL